jgi:hypothetical protein
MDRLRHAAVVKQTSGVHSCAATRAAAPCLHLKPVCDRQLFHLVHVCISATSVSRRALSIRKSCTYVPGLTFRQATRSCPWVRSSLCQAGFLILPAVSRQSLQLAQRLLQQNHNRSTTPSGCPSSVQASVGPKAIQHPIRYTTPRSATLRFESRFAEVLYQPGDSRNIFF